MMEYTGPATPDSGAMLTFTVVPALAEFTDKAAIKRAEMRKRIGSQNRNNLVTTFDEDIRMHIKGCRGEAGLYQFLGGKRAGVKWNAYSDSASILAEIIHLGVSYDAKAIDREGLALCVPPRTVHPVWRYVLVDISRWPQVRMCGWCPGADVLTSGLKDRAGGRPAYFIDQDDDLMRDCSEFLPRVNAFSGYCACGKPGLYHAHSKWYCNDHRVA